MASGMAHVSGSVMAAYVKVAHVEITHLLTAVIMTAPATIMLAKILVPETEVPVTAGKVEIKVEKTAVNIIDAAAQGAGDGLHLALNVAGMLIAFLALIAMVNGIMGWAHQAPFLHWLPDSLEKVFGFVFAPVAFIMGVPWKDASTIGDLLGTRLVLNEFVAFLKLGPHESLARPALFRDRHLRPVRVRQFQLDRHPDRRHRRAGAEPEIRPGATGPAGRGRRHHGELHVGLHCWNVAVILEAKTVIESRTALRPAIGVVLGSGLGAFAEELCERVEMPYSEIPGWPGSTAVGHAGKLVIGKLDGRPVAVMAGRAHLYEGHTPAQAVFGVRVLGSLGVRSMVFTNAAGGIDTTLERGGLVLIADHINLQGSNPLVGPNDDSLGPRFPDMSEAYSHSYREIAKTVAAELCIHMPEGVYAAMLGPSYETPAEIRFLRDHRRRHGGHVDRARGHRGEPYGHEGARHFLRHQYGGRRICRRRSITKRCWKPAPWCAIRWSGF